MCGIIAYVGHRPALPVVIEGLHHLEYRGYDSAGVCFIQGNKLHTIKAEGKLSALEKKLSSCSTVLTTTAIGHTRWATHGAPSEKNAHPHTNEKQDIAIVHNGIIENHQELKEQLLHLGYSFVSETDTEVLVHLVTEGYKKSNSILQSFAWALNQTHGSYAVALISKYDPSTIFAARKSAPLILGVGVGENFIASDIPAFLSYTKDVIFLEDSEIVCITNNTWNIASLSSLSPIKKHIHTIPWDMQSAQKSGYKHFMLKEIFEQPQVIADCLKGRLDFANKKILIQELEHMPIPKRLTIVACGSSYHAGMWGKTILENWAKIPTSIEIASEFRYQAGHTLAPEDIIIVISQSGETADTLAALHLAKEKGCIVIALCNVIGSNMTREADLTIYTQAGPEISVASTKAVCSQMMLLMLITLYYTQIKNILPTKNLESILNDIQNLPETIEQILPSLQKTAKKIAAQYAHVEHFFFLGRGQGYPLALEGSLKLKELSYIHAEAYPAGEMKHGAIALIDQNFPTIAIIMKDHLTQKIKSNIAEIQARGGSVIAIASDQAILTNFSPEYLWLIPEKNLCTSFLMLPAMQLFSYEVAVYLGKDVDQPRNLAKSVTVE